MNILINMSKENSQEFIFVWEIQNFSFDFYKIGDAIDSPDFEIDSFGGSQWCLRLYPRGEDNNSAQYISIYLYKKKNDIYSEECSLIYDLEFVGDKSKNIIKLTAGNYVYKLNERFGFKTFATVNGICTILKKWPGNVLTVRCHMFNTKKQRNIPRFEVSTKVSVNRKLFLWNVNTSDSLSKLIKKDLMFTEASLYEITLSILNNAFKICISQKEESVLPMLITCQLSQVNSKGVKLSSINSSHLFETNDKNEIWEIPNFISKPNNCDNLCLFCEFFCSNGIKMSPNSAHGTTTFDGNRTVLKDFKIMLQSHIHSDIQFKVENEVLHAHKAILASRSPVFLAMFNQDMMESKTGVIIISDVEANVFKLFLEYLYTDTAENLDLEKAKKLFVIADKYQVSSLAEICVIFLEKILSLENVCEILFVADMVGHERLKKVLMKFIALNSGIIFSSPQWQDIMRENGKFAAEMISTIATNLKIVED